VALPRSALLTLWLTAALRGSVGPDDFADAVRGEDPQHLVLGWPGAEEPLGLAALPAAVRRNATTAVLLALPVPGDSVGLAGPPDFNTDALDAEEAVLLVGSMAVGLVPHIDARTVIWQATEARAPMALDPDEAGRTLRKSLIEVTAELVRLDVASWQPEIPDLLLNVRHRAPLALPPDARPEQVDVLERADLCRDIVGLALEGEGGAVSAYELDQRRRCLTDLDRAARRAIAALCSDSLARS
jgi:hypothetical protein